MEYLDLILSTYSYIYFQLLCTGTRPKKRSGSRKGLDRTLILDSDPNSPSTSQNAAALSLNNSESRNKSGPKSQSRRKSSLNRSSYNNNMRKQSSSASTSTGGSPKKRVKKKGKSLQRRLRESVLDESADWRQRFRQTEEKNRKLEEKLLIKKQAAKSQQDHHRRELKVLNCFE